MCSPCLTDNAPMRVVETKVLGVRRCPVLSPSVTSFGPLLGEEAKLESLEVIRPSRQAFTYDSQLKRLLLITEIDLRIYKKLGRSLPLQISLILTPPTRQGGLELQLG